MSDINEGHGIIAGRSRDNAQKAIAAAIAAGLDPTVVRTVAEGYIVPEAALAEFEKAAKAEAAPKKASTKKPAAKPAPKKAAPEGADATEEAPAKSETDNKEE